MEGLRWGVRVAPQEVSTPVPGPRNAMGWRMKLVSWCEREDLWGRREEYGPPLFHGPLNFSPYSSRDRMRHRTRNHMMAGGELGAARSLCKAL